MSREVVQPVDWGVASDGAGVGGAWRGPDNVVVVTDDQPLAWFYRLAPDVQDALLADPLGPLPAGLAPKIPAQVFQSHWVGNDGGLDRWELHPSAARQLEAERQRLAAAPESGE